MPILNHRDYRLAKARRLRLQKAIESAVVVGQLATNLSTDVMAARKAALAREFGKVSEELEAYERLQSQQYPVSGDMDVQELGLLPIVGRIMRRLSQRQMAELLDVKEQQIQRYERERYDGVSLARYKEILELLGIQLRAQFASSRTKEGVDLPVEAAVELSPKLIREIEQRGWLGTSDVPSADDKRELIAAYIQRGIGLMGEKPFYRRTLSREPSIDASSVIAWQSRIALVAELRRLQMKARFDFSDMSWVPQLVSLSRSDSGPALAIDFLASKGIVLVIEAHLSNSYLDGAAFILSDGTPVIGLTIRYDRLDNFWFVLLHELGHIFLHYNRGLERGFLDDLDDVGQTDVEKEADGFARSALIPDEMWNTAPARFAKSPELIRNFAAACGVHPAIVVGRIRHERHDFALFNNMVGQNGVRKLFS